MPTNCRCLICTQILLISPCLKYINCSFMKNLKTCSSILYAYLCNAKEQPAIKVQFFWFFIFGTFLSSLLQIATTFATNIRWIGHSVKMWIAHSLLACLEIDFPKPRHFCMFATITNWTRMINGANSDVSLKLSTKNWCSLVPSRIT